MKCQYCDNKAVENWCVCRICESQIQSTREYHEKEKVKE